MVFNSIPNSVSRIWVAWNPNILEGKQLHCNEQAITLSIKIKSHPHDTFILTVVYGYNEKSNRRELWRKLRYQHQIYGNLPWIIMGDFNIILDSQDKIGEKRIDRNAIREFKDWIRDMDIINLPSRGCKYTWSNNRSGDQRVYTKIDHMFCNDLWKSQNPHFQLDYEPPLTSDHSRGILTIQKDLNFGPKPFKFMKGWLKHPKFKQILMDSWGEYVSGNPLDRLTKKLKCLKIALKSLNKDEYSDIKNRVEMAKKINWKKHKNHK